MEKKENEGGRRASEGYILKEREGERLLFGDSLPIEKMFKKIS